MLHGDVIARGKRSFKRIRVVAPAYAGSELTIDRSSPAQIRNVGQAVRSAQRPHEASGRP